MTRLRAFLPLIVALSLAACAPTVVTPSPSPATPIPPTATAAPAAPSGSSGPASTPGLAPAPGTDAIDPSIYLDDRSNGRQVVRSYYNAINRHEYLRAYSYWEPGHTAVAPFAQFSGGFIDTASVQITTGTSTTGAGAGQLDESVPLGILSYGPNGALRTYAGCYRMHLGSPSAQATPPFQPFGIQSAIVREVPNGSGIGDLLKTACPAT